MRRYLELFAIQVKAAALLSMQYRVDFLIQGVMALFWCGTALVPLLVLFAQRPGVAGWSAHEAMIVVGFFMALKGFLVGVIQPSLSNVVEHIRKGTLDFLLLKPADAQFLLSTSKLDLPRIVDVLSGLALVLWSLKQLSHVPTPSDVALSVLALLCAVAILYSIWIMIVSLSFHVVKIDNLSHLIVSTFDAARWPSSVFRGALAFLFTFIVPLTLMTTYPALALLGKLSFSHVARSLGVAALFMLISRQIWLRSIRSYTGAGG